VSERPDVVLLIETSNEYSRGLLRGIMAYVREHGPWSIYLPEQGRGEAPPGWLKRWHGDGIIARIETPQIARAVARARLPAVDVSAARLLPVIPWVETDDEAFTRAAVDHLLQRGFRQFGFCGEPRFNWSKWRREHFERMVAASGGQCHVYESAATPGKPVSHRREHRRLVAWVRKLPKPIGVMACYDIKGQQLLDACREAGVAVPEEVAVIGVDNDDLLCNLATPPLSSVIPNTHRTGYQAAALLGRMMAGERLGEQSHRIPPLGIATRQSTDILAIDDPEVATAVRFIRRRACEGINVADVLKDVPLTRRDLESRFRRILGCTPHEEIVRVRIDRVKQLLSETDLPMTRVAQLAGYTHVEYMSAAFKKCVGLSPRQYRRTSQG
jgi:LacI family transcriptional regulator